jgi:hypothetical protein
MSSQTSLVIGSRTTGTLQEGATTGSGATGWQPHPVETGVTGGGGGVNTCYCGQGSATGAGGGMGHPHLWGSWANYLIVGSGSGVRQSNCFLTTGTAQPNLLPHVCWAEAKVVDAASAKI